MGRRIKCRPRPSNSIPDGIPQAHVRTLEVVLDGLVIAETRLFEYPVRSFIVSVGSSSNVVEACAALACGRHDLEERWDQCAQSLCSITFAKVIYSPVTKTLSCDNFTVASVRAWVEKVAYGRSVETATDSNNVPFARICMRTSLAKKHSEIEDVRTESSSTEPTLYLLSIGLYTLGRPSHYLLPTEYVKHCFGICDSQGS
jgi:hypothetical protein